MSCKLFIGGLSWNTSEESLRSRFEQYGIVEEATVIRNRETGRSRGFGFVTFQNDKEAQSAIDALNEQDFDGRTIRVDKAGNRTSSGAGNRSSGFGGGRSYAHNNRSYGSSYGYRSGGDRYPGEHSNGYRRER